ncbi:MAG: 23S rRNA (uracil(1939)-C(5))-methyltransferase RlmD, partial [Gammaproteobacteria bacterium]|nr:23S rRNA (uracil(1939)-C(5))-methyltransferase RlmD [Gammaproteobacteria bacterium]
AIRQTSAHREIPQIEVAVAENAVAMIFRHLKPLNHADQQVLIELGQKLNYQIFLQPKGPNTVHCIWPSQTPDQLKYHLNDFGLQLNFRATDFTQVNTAINQQMVKRAVEFLQLDGSETVLDLFCGLGNFSLPIARQAKHVIGVEGEQAMVERASDNAKLNNIENVEFHTANLFEDFSALPWVKPVDKMLIDPPRSGAIQIAEQIKRFKPKLIVYVSCDPATLARDAGELVNNQGYKLMKAGVMDMFPHTTHVESIAVFEK